MDLDVGANRDVDEARVPDELKSLLPYVRRWGYERNSDQDDFVAAMLLERPEEIPQFKQMCDQHHQEYHAWIRALPKKHKDEMTESDWSHPSFAYTSMYCVRDLLPLEEHEITNEMRAVDKRMQADRRRELYLQAINDADTAFREKDYGQYIQLLAPYEDLMEGVVVKKYQLAQKRHDASG